VTRFPVQNGSVCIYGEWYGPQMSSAFAQRVLHGAMLGAARKCLVDVAYILAGPEPERVSPPEALRVYVELALAAASAAAERIPGGDLSDRYTLTTADTSDRLDCTIAKPVEGVKYDFSEPAKPPLLTPDYHEVLQPVIGGESGTA